MTTHHFDTGIAQDVGVNAAILYQNICFWIDKNAANEKHFIEGRYWTYNSVAAFGKLFPYLGRGAIENALKKLIAEGYLVASDFNKSAYDRTKWYALGDRMIADSTKDGMAPIGNEMGCLESVTLPDNKPDNKQNTNPLSETAAPPSDVAVGQLVDDDYLFAEEMWEVIQPITNAKGVNLQSWANTIRLLRERDGRDLNTIRTVFCWANSDGFWRANILSADTLRKQFDSLYAKSQQPRSSRDSSYAENLNDTAWAA